MVQSAHGESTALAAVSVAAEEPGLAPASALRLISDGGERCGISPCGDRAVFDEFGLSREPA